MAGRRFDSSLPPIFELANRHLAVYICFSNSAKQGVGPISKFFRNGATVVKIEDEVYRSPWLFYMDAGTGKSVVVFQRSTVSESM